MPALEHWRQQLVRGHSCAEGRKTVPNSGTWYVCKCLNRWCSHLCSLRPPPFLPHPKSGPSSWGRPIAVPELWTPSLLAVSETLCYRFSPCPFSLSLSTYSFPKAFKWTPVSPTLKQRPLDTTHKINFNPNSPPSALLSLYYLLQPNSLAVLVYLIYLYFLTAHSLHLMVQP